MRDNRVNAPVLDAYDVGNHDRRANRVRRPLFALGASGHGQPAWPRVFHMLYKLRFGGAFFFDSKGGYVIATVSS